MCILNHLIEKVVGGGGIQRIRGERVDIRETGGGTKGERERGEGGRLTMLRNIYKKRRRV